jgi:hypothetical protein
MDGTVTSSRAQPLECKPNVSHEETVTPDDIEDTAATF